MEIKFKKIKSGIVLSVLALVGVFAFGAGSALAFTDNGDTTCNCGGTGVAAADCDDCELALNNANCTTVYLDSNITNQVGTCIDDPANFQNKIFDCQGNTIDGTNQINTYGIYLNGKDDNTIKNCNVTQFYDGIFLESSSNNNITDNTVNYNDENGILLHTSSNNNITDNTANDNNRGGLYTTADSINNEINSNTFCSNNQSGGAYYDIQNINQTKK